MHTNEVRIRFIELRAQGWSLARIAAELHVAKRTLVDWNREAQREIRDLKEVEVEALHERILVSHEQELAQLTGHLNRIEAVLAKRNLECLSTESLFVLAATVRAQLRRVTASPVFGREDSSLREASATARSSETLLSHRAAPSPGGAA